MAKNLEIRSGFSKLKITGKRLIMRPYRSSDFNICRASHLGRLPAKNKFDIPMSVSKDTNIKMFKKRIERHKSIGKNRQHFIFGLFEKHSGDFVGQVDIMTINLQLRWGNLGYNIQNQYRGNGYASEGSRLALKAAFERLGFHRIEASMEKRNIASERVALKAGLKPEGLRRKFFAERGGIDMKVYATNAIDFG